MPISRWTPPKCCRQKILTIPKISSSRYENRKITFLSSTIELIAKFNILQWPVYSFFFCRWRLRIYCMCWIRAKNPILWRRNSFWSSSSYLRLCWSSTWCSIRTWVRSILINSCAQQLTVSLFHFQVFSDLKHEKGKCFLFTSLFHRWLCVSKNHDYYIIYLFISCETFAI